MDIPNEHRINVATTIKDEVEDIMGEFNQELKII